MMSLEAETKTKAFKVARHCPRCGYHAYHWAEPFGRKHHIECCNCGHVWKGRITRHDRGEEVRPVSASWCHAGGQLLGYGTKHRAGDRIACELCGRQVTLTGRFGDVGYPTYPRHKAGS